MKKTILHCILIFLSGLMAGCSTKDNTYYQSNLNSFTECSASIDNGDWITEIKIDPLTDKNIYLASLIASSEKNQWGRDVVLFVRCSNGKTEMFINWGLLVGFFDEQKVTYRVDKENAKSTNWVLSTDKHGTFLSNPMPVLRRLYCSNSFVANTTPLNSNPITAIFNTEGADQALADIRKACNW